MTLLLIFTLFLKIMNPWNVFLLLYFWSPLPLSQIQFTPSSLLIIHFPEPHWLKGWLCLLSSKVLISFSIPQYISS